MRWRGPARRQAPAPTVWIVLVAVQQLALALVGTVWAIFLVNDVGAGPLALVLVGTTLEGTVLLFEVPTGVLADVAGRRRSVLVGTAVSGLGFLLYAVPSLPAVLAAQVVWGFGYTFISGADVAWITDEVGEERATDLYVRAAQVGPVVTLAGIGAAAALALVALWLPILTAGLLMLGSSLWLWARMPEENFSRPERAAGAPEVLGGAVARFRTTMAGGVRSTVHEVRRRPFLLGLLAAAVLLGAASEGFDRLWELHLLKGVGVPAGLSAVVWLGILRAVGLVLSLGAVEIVRRRADLRSPAGSARVVVVATVGIAAGTLGIALAGGFWVLAAALWVGGAFRRAQGPALRAWLNNGLDPRVRASVNSLFGQADALGQVGGGPALGGVASFASVRAALAGAAALQLAAAPVLRASAVEGARELSPRDGGAADGRQHVAGA